MTIPTPSTTETPATAAGPAATEPGAASLRIDGGRLVARLTELRSIGASDDGGVTREAYGPADVAGRDLVAGWMREAGLDVQVDAAANLIGRRPGTLGTLGTQRWLVSGSHLDTVVDGGWLDGAYGVVAAVEVAATLASAPPLSHGLTVVAYANEEGARGSQGMAGSRALVGLVGEAELTALDDRSVTLAERLRQSGGHPERLEEAVWDRSSVDAVVELHIEQGPVLDTAGLALGVVTAITGRQSLDVTIVGAANHAGTTPMSLRHDALVAAAEVVLAIESMPTAGWVRVATCGHIAVAPNVRNVVPGHVQLSAELRDEDAARLDAVMPEVDAAVRSIAERRGATITTVWGQRVQPTICHPSVVDVVREVARGSGLTWTEMPSGAGHDAQILGREIPMGMIFVPSTGGLSHAPHEDTAAEHLAAGAQALLEALVALDHVHEAPSASDQEAPR